MLDTFGIVGVSAGALVSTAMLLYAGVRAHIVFGIVVELAGAAARHGAVSLVVTTAVFLGALFAGVIPGIDWQVLGGLVTELLGWLGSLVR
ncbi:hypothetical protein ACFQL2_16300 [Halosegnis marinus]